MIVGNVKSTTGNMSNQFRLVRRTNAIPSKTTFFSKMKQVVVIIRNEKSTRNELDNALPSFASSKRLILASAT